jgi:HEAT repeat protein
LALVMACIAGPASGGSDAGELARTLRKGSVEDRIAAARALGDPSVEVSDILPALGDALRDPYWAVRHSAAKALGRSGRAAVPVLVRAAKRDDFYSRWYAARTLKRIGPAAAEASETLRKLVEIGGIDVKAEAALALKETETADGAVEELARAMTHRNARVRTASARAIAAAGRSAVAPLVELLQHDDPGVQVAAARAVGRIGPDADKAVPALIGVMKRAQQRAWDRYGQIKSGAIRYSRIRGVMGNSIVLEALGRMGKPAVGPLRECLDPNDPELARWAVAALGKIGPPAAEAIPELIALWKSRNNRKWTWYCLRGHIAGTFSSMRKKAAPAVDFLVGQLENTPRARPSLNYTLAGIGAPAVKPLAELLQTSDDPGARKTAAGILGKIGKEAAGARSALKRAANAKDDAVRKAAEKALERIPEE